MDKTRELSTARIMVSPGKAAFSVTCVGIIVYGIVDYLSNFEQNNCMMTYMFEMPEYIKIPMGKKLREKYPRYRLLIYGEGELAKNLKRNIKVTGIPVLFIPGNAGSYKQARSLASVAYRRAHDKRTQYHFDYFTVDFNEEFSALYGGMLYDQTEFVHECVKKILSLYEDNGYQPSSVILVGHSMGGMIARALFTLPGFDQQSVNTIITQATPHQAPVIPLDRMIAHYYNRVNDYWRKNNNTKLKHVTIVSTGGGYRDILVRNGLTSLRGIADPTLSISTSTMSVPNAWVSTDHLCAVWCKQMVMLTKRAMFDIIDTYTYQVNKDTSQRMAVFKYYFLSYTGTNRVLDYWKKDIVLDESILWIIKKEKTWEFAKIRVQQDYYYAVPMNQEGVNSFVAISNVDLQEWICICKLEPGQNRCKTCRNLSQIGKVIPPLDSHRKVVHVDFKDYPEMTHIVLIIPAVPHQVEVMGDSYDKDYRHLSYKLPSVPDIIMTYPESVMKGVSVLTLNNDSLFYNLKLKGLDSVLRAFTVQLIPRRCTSNAGLHEGNMISLHIPWSQEDVYSFSRINEVGNLSIKLQSGVPLGDDYNDNIELRIYTDPSCSYQFKIIASPSESLGQLIRFYGKLFPCFMVVIVLMGLIYQLHMLRTERKCPDIVESISAFGAPFKIVPVAFIIRFIIQISAVERFISSLGLPLDDSKMLMNQGIYSATLPFMLYVISLGIVNFHCYIIVHGIRLNSKIMSVLFGWTPSFILNLFGNLKYVLLLIALSLSFILCGSLGIIICYVICILWTLRQCHLARVSQQRDADSKFNLSVTILIICMWTAALNFPSSISWAKNIQYTIFLSDDPNKLMSVLAVIAMSTILVLNDPVSGRMSYYFMVPVVYVINVWLLLYGIVSVYRISYATTLVLSGLAVIQLYYRIKLGKPIEIGQEKFD